MKNISLTIDGRKTTVPSDYTIMKAAEELDIDIPALCYDPTLEITGSCRMCVVEIEGKNKIETSCSTIVREGMVVHTESPRIQKIRKDILQMLLDSHPNDCLTCQKAGECLLQDYAFKYEVKFRDHGGAMRPQLMDTSSPYILRDNSKCILCGKCVLTCAQVADRQVMNFGGRGYDTKIVLDTDESFAESTCVSCNRCVVVCPVGALVDKRLLGKIRSWEGEKLTVRCESCDYGCNFQVLSKDEENIAIRALEPANGRPLCLEGRLATELIYVDKPDKPYIKKDRIFEETNWVQALGVDKILEKIESLEDGK